jgi:divinyl protochlorophyllide a 8-vinyl-reductase
MVDEREVIALHAAVRRRLTPQAARGVAHAAGLATADYLLEHRIPGAAQLVLRALPAPLASRLLLAAITRHAWTFAGSARFTAHSGHPVLLRLEGCPICRGAQSAAPLCEYYAATFTRLYSSLVHPRAEARETACMATGAAACEFRIEWRA